MCWTEWHVNCCSTIDSIHCAPCGKFNEAVIDLRSSAARCCYIRNRWFARLLTIALMLQLTWRRMVTMLSRAALCSVDDNSYSTVGQWTRTVCTPYTNSHLQRRHVSYDGYRYTRDVFHPIRSLELLLTENAHDVIGKLYVFASVA